MHEGGLTPRQMALMRLLISVVGVSVTVVLVACGGSEDPAASPAGAESPATSPAGPESSAVRPSAPASAPVASGSWDVLPAVKAKHYQELKAVTVGSQVVIVSGVDGTQSRLKALAFDRGSERWRRTTSPLEPRFGYSAVAAGDEVLVWGGCCGPGGGDGSQADGIRYEVAVDEWRAMAKSPLADRFSHSAVWTGEEMIVWGGIAGSPGGTGGDVTSTGAAYDPRTNAWREISDAPIDARSNHVGVWTGEEMIIWGGALGRYRGDETQLLSSSGGAYSPESDTWREIATAPIPSRAGAEAVWTGEEMIVWNSEAGAAYDPAVDAWRELPDAPRGLAVYDTVVWSEATMLVWGGGGASGHADGIAYDPGSDEWARIPKAPLAGRDRHAAVSTDDGMLVWGGCCAGSDYYSDGATYALRGTPSSR